MKLKAQHPLRLAGILLAGLLFFMPVATFADYLESFSTYTSGTVSPGPWMTTTTSPSCLPGFSNATVLAHTNPDAFNFKMVSSCYGFSNSASTSININASATVLTIGWYQGLIDAVSQSAGTHSGYAANLAIFTVKFDGSTVYTNDTSSMASFSTTTAENWHKESVVVNTLQGKHTISFGISMAVSGSPYGGYFTLDDISIKGANVIVHPRDFTLIDYQTQQWYNISGYSDSHINFQYSSAINCATYNLIQAGTNNCLTGTTAFPLQIPDLYVALSGLSLITVYVGGSAAYARTLIPMPNLLSSSSPANQTMFLDEPVTGALYAYELTVNDLTKQFPGGTTEIFILKGSQVITSGYLGYSSTFPMVMAPGSYTVDLINPANPTNVFSSTLPLSTTNAAPSLLVQSQAFTQTTGALQQFAYSIGWDCDAQGITASFTDNLGTMTKIWISLVRDNSSGQFTINTNIQTDMPTSGTPVTLTHDFRASAVGAQLNVANSTQYLIGYNVTLGSSGTQMFGDYPVPYGNSQCPSNFPAQGGKSSGFNLPPNLLGLNEFFGGANPWGAMLSMIIVVLTANIFGARLAHVGMIVIGGEMYFFWLVSWLPITVGFVSIIMFVGTLGFLSNRARRPIT
jgi:hypothetical protein